MTKTKPFVAASNNNENPIEIRYPCGCVYYFDHEVNLSSYDYGICANHVDEVWNEASELKKSSQSQEK